MAWGTSCLQLCTEDRGIGPRGFKNAHTRGPSPLVGVSYMYHDTMNGGVISLTRQFTLLYMQEAASRLAAGADTDYRDCAACGFRNVPTLGTCDLCDAALSPVPSQFAATPRTARTRVAPHAVAAAALQALREDLANLSALSARMARPARGDDAAPLQEVEVARSAAAGPPHPKRARGGGGGDGGDGGGSLAHRPEATPRTAGPHGATAKMTRRIIAASEGSCPSAEPPSTSGDHAAICTPALAPPRPPPTPANACNADSAAAANAAARAPPTHRAAPRAVDRRAASAHGQSSSNPLTQPTPPSTAAPAPKPTAAPGPGGARTASSSVIEPCSCAASAPSGPTAPSAAVVAEPHFREQCLPSGERRIIGFSGPGGSHWITLNWFPQRCVLFHDDAFFRTQTRTIYWGVAAHEWEAIARAPTHGAWTAALEAATGRARQAGRSRLCPSDGPADDARALDD